MGEKISNLGLLTSTNGDEISTQGRGVDGNDDHHLPKERNAAAVGGWLNPGGGSWCRVRRGGGTGRQWWWWWGGEAKKFGGTGAEEEMVVGWAVDFGWVHERGMNRLGWTRARARVARSARGPRGGEHDLECGPGTCRACVLLNGLGPSLFSHTRFGVHRAHFPS